jgi:hypothetical protein
MYCILSFLLYESFNSLVDFSYWDFKKSSGRWERISRKRKRRLLHNKELDKRMLFVDTQFDRWHFHYSMETDSRSYQCQEENLPNHHQYELNVQRCT